MDIRDLDAADPVQMAAFHATYHAAHVHGREVSTPWMLEEMRADFLGQRTGERTCGFSGYVDGRVVAVGVVELPLKDNTHLAHVEVYTLPEMRGRGYGSAMLAHLTALVRAEGRRTLTVEVAAPYDAPADGAGHPDVDFLTRRGFTFSLGNVMRMLDLPVDTERLRRLAAEVAPYHADYTLRRFRGPVPEDILESFGALIGTLMTEAPSGGTELEPEQFDAERIRSDEAVFAASGRTKLTTIALASDGDVVAYSELVVPAHDPGRVYQWGTLVKPAHRGHRLGLAAKVANLQWLHEEHPDARLLVTYNAEVNAPMIAVNEAMGFRPVERLVELQKKLD